MDTQLLFVYGTLLDPENEEAAFLHAHGRFHSEARIRGRLYDAGGYPAAIPDKSADTWIHGSLLLVNEPDAVFPHLDAYEGFGNDQPLPNEFVRVRVEAEAGVNRLTCWIYAYNYPSAELPEIASGKYF